jgi:hypothetical protein
MQEQREIFKNLVPPEVLKHFQLSPFLVDQEGNNLMKINPSENKESVELALYHQRGFQDPVIYGHLTDTMNGQIIVLLYIMNDPESPRFNVDKLPDGTPTKFGTQDRNLPAEEAAMEAGLSPGQLRRGFGMFGEAKAAFDRFVTDLGHDRYFIEPLYYHNAIIFERYGFTYQSGRKKMERIHAGFSAEGDLREKLDGSRFRAKNAAESIRLRSWAVHDGILGEPFSNVTMYHVVGKPAGVETAPGINW